MFSGCKKAFLYVIVILLVMSIVGSTFGYYYYPKSHYWSFKNHSYVGFNREMNFIEEPRQGIPDGGSLIAYWNFNEGQGLVVQDLSGNGNNGTVFGATWVPGHSGSGLNFNGTNAYVQAGSLNITTSNTICTWIKASTTGNTGLRTIMQNYAAAGIGLFLNNGIVDFRVYTNSGYTWASGTTDLRDNTWHFIAATWDATVKQTKLYIDGTLAGQRITTENMKVSAGNTTIGQYNNDFWYNGTIDDIQVLNRTLSATEVAFLYLQPDVAAFADYYNFHDPITNNTMLVYISIPNRSGDSVTLVTCTSLFESNRLSFQANGSAFVNVWTNLGKPTFTNGVWNSQNQTTSLTLDASLITELNWLKYNITTFTDAASTVLPSNVTASHGESQTLTFSAKPRYSFNVIINGLSMGQIASYTFDNVTAPHTVNVVSTFELQPTASPQPTPFPTEAVLVAVSITTGIAIVAVAFAYKKGYIVIEDIDESSKK